MACSDNEWLEEALEDATRANLKLRDRCLELNVDFSLAIQELAFRVEEIFLRQM